MTAKSRARTGRELHLPAISWRPHAMIQELAKLVFDVAVAMIQSAIAFAHRHRFGLLTVLVLFLCLQAIYRDYAELTDNEITIYTGLPGSSCHEIAGKLRDSLRLRSTAFGGKYKV